MGLLEILGRDYGIEKPYWGPSKSSSTNYPVWTGTFLLIFTSCTDSGRMGGYDSKNDCEMFKINESKWL